ncbi:GerAB/ArcD/ProY family transporter [Sporosarcina sp. Marseille-Q4063]|uniref:GerAB/ArcD/ProY family transporter n=1 Tax=Sporosarcina sp. Marseille-Q4063 TaxID=2810514 RepID=UPI001BAF5A09|nr:GerAB/ArcD/ProY family transporter [Sporosarcina sp. Marseille-Q4063]QUW23125.1 GerAB/ArcD/ProY family transporter [Sporosarcina sp. Marseille-Q4063]
MDDNKLKVLNRYHVVFLVQNVIIGTAVLSLPHRLSSMGYSLWWMPLLFGVVANLLLIPIIWLGQKYRNDTLFAIHEKLFGKWVGKTINAILLVYFIIVLAAVFSSYIQLIQVVALVDRKITAPLIFLLLMTIYIVSGGIKSIARFCMMSFFITLGLLYFLKWSIVDGDIRHMLPFFNFTFNEFFTASKKGLMAIGGFELISFYFPYIINQKKAFKHASLGLWLSIAFALAFTFVSVMFFSEWQIENVLYPVLNLFKEVELSYLERIDVLGITMWVFLILSTTAAYFWVAKKGFDSVLSRTKKRHLYFVAGFIFILVKIPYMEAFQKLLFERIFYMMYALFLWPILLCLIHMIKPKKNEGLE